MLAKDIMTPDVVTVLPSEPVYHVAQLLLDRRISAVLGSASRMRTIS